MKSAKLTLTLVLCLLLCLCLLPTASADDGAQEPMGLGEPGFFSYADIEPFPVSSAPLSVSSAETYDSASSVSVTLPKNTKTIGAEAFAGCRNMTSLHVPAGVTKITDGAFAGCTSLREIYYDGSLNQALSADIGANNECLYNAIIYCAGGERIIPIVPRHFPDNAFRSYVYQNFDTDKNGALTNAEIQAVTRISCYGMGIESLQGVEFFTELTFLDCGFNALTELDVTRNTKLESLGFAANSITSIDLSKAPNLRILSSGMERQEEDGTWHTYGNPLTRLDVTHNPKLAYLECGGNDLTALDVSKNPALVHLGCWLNNIASLNLSNNRELMMLACAQNPVGTLNLSQNTKLQQLHCMNCGLSSLNLSYNTQLVRVRCFDNQLTSLNVSNCSKLDALLCQNNQLTGLNVQSCSALTQLNCAANRLTSLNVSYNQNLVYLNCWNNRLTSINLSQNTALKSVNLSANHTLSSVTLGSLPNLEMLRLQNNSLSSVNIRYCPTIALAYNQGTMYDFGREGLKIDNGNWVGYQYGEGLNPGSSNPLDRVQFCVDKGVSVVA